MGAPTDTDARHDLAGRRIVLTGPTSGIGAVMAETLSRRGAHLLLIARDARRLDTTLRLLTGGGGSAEGFVCDLAEPAAVRELADRLRAGPPRIDVLINNAGALFHERRVNRQGDERTFALNVLAPFVLMERLWPSLEASGAGRIVNLSSAAHRSGRIALDDLDRVRRWGPWAAYAQSKLALLLLTREAPRRHPGSRVTVNACHPGFVRSHFGLEGRGWGPRLFRVLQAIGAIAPERGARTPLFLATDPSVAGITGGYFARQRLVRGSARSSDPAIAARLWEICAERTGLAPAPGRSAMAPGAARSPAPAA
ncbi:MAG: SDR family NAD(P)-dependent oxidoreductase [Thermoplasmata archaeon]